MTAIPKDDTRVIHKSPRFFEDIEKARAVNRNIKLSTIRKVRNYLDSRKAKDRRKAEEILETIPGGLATVNEVDDLFRGRLTPRQKEAHRKVEEAIEQINLIRSNRAEFQTIRGLKQDKNKLAKTVAPQNPQTEAEKKLVEKWKNHPDRLDRKGFDTPGSKMTQEKLDRARP